MEGLPELQAYKQLLEVTENILNQLSPEQQILKKYYTLKKSILSKVKIQPDKSLSTRFLASYKLITKNIIESITEFETQIEGQMNKQIFLKNSHKLIKEIQKEGKILTEELNGIVQVKENKGIKLMVKEQLNSLKFISKQFQGKIENMGLMIEVHRKMHEIILQASEKQAKTTQKQIQYNKRLSQMQNVVEKIHDVKLFIESYEITQKKARKFQMAKKSLAKVLFDL